MSKVSVAIGNYSPGGFGGVNTHIAQILSYCKKQDINLKPFNLRDSTLSTFFQSLHEFFHIKNSPFVEKKSKIFRSADIVHVHATLFALYAALHAKKDKDVKIIATHHTAADPKIIKKKISGYSLHKRIFYSRFMKGLLLSYPDIDAVIAVAKWIQKDLKKFWGIKSEYIPNMINFSAITPVSYTALREYGIKLPQEYVVWLGARADSPVYKRPCDFVKLACAIPDVWFVMPGRVDINILEQLCGTLPKNLIIVPASSYDFRRDVFLSIIQHAKLSVLTSYYEGFGYTILESLALGVPVLVPDTGGPPEIVSSKKIGRVYRTGDIDSLVSGFTKIWSDVKNGKYSSKMLHTYVLSNYSEKVVAPRIINLYLSL